MYRGIYIERYIYIHAQRLCAIYIYVKLYTMYIAPSLSIYIKYIIYDVINKYTYSLVHKKGRMYE